ncbi:MAG TPA: hypothetical protein PKD58_12510 [Candidatus Sumerlaeota bacterium]|nr:hypothetical protein [Cyclobacteriaceae bacterium]HMX63881.1 hypothetical protein [Candidatus Sumerlaeota bacterium]
MSTTPALIEFGSDGLFEAFRDQLHREFQHLSFPAGFVPELKPDYHQIQDAIAAALDKQIQLPHFSLAQMLYRIDISESQVKRYVHNSPDVPFLHVVAELIIKRVLEKTVMRKHYGSGNK